MTHLGNTINTLQYCREVKMRGVSLLFATLALADPLCFLNDWQARDAAATERKTFDHGRWSFEGQGGRYL